MSIFSDLMSVSKNDIYLFFPDLMKQCDLIKKNLINFRQLIEFSL
jgi:hypothetical protein